MPLLAMGNVAQVDTGLTAIMRRQLPRNAEPQNSGTSAFVWCSCRHLCRGVGMEISTPFCTRVRRPCRLTDVAVQAWYSVNTEPRVKGHTHHDSGHVAVLGASAVALVDALIGACLGIRAMWEDRVEAPRIHRDIMITAVTQSLI